jgi:hypothetical protein
VRFFSVFTTLAIAATGVAGRIDVPGHLLATPPVIDGNLTPEEWGDVPSIEGGFDEETGAPADDRTQYWFSYDQRYVYFAARAHDGQPRSIRAQETRTNVSLRGEDRVGLVLQPFGQLNDVNIFEINPLGGTFMRIAGGRAGKREWLGEIQAAGRITESGYEIEARIPWSLMKMPPAGRRDMRVGSFRYISRVGRSYLVADISGGKIENFPFWRDVDVPSMTDERTVKLLPYGYLGWERENGLLANGGLDLKTTLGPRMDLVGSINPDFRNIENQVLSLDFSYFERLAGESRPFFLEGQMFSQLPSDSQIFASQRIPGFDMGVKAFGQMTDRTRVSVLDTIQFGERNDFVATAWHEAGPNTSVVASLADHAQISLHNQATATGVMHRMAPYSFYAMHQGTRDSVRGRGDRINGGAEYRSNGFMADIEYRSVSPDFLPRLGFAPEVGYKGVTGYLQQRWLARSGPVMETVVSGSFQSYDKYHGGGRYRRQGNVNGSVILRNQTLLSIGLFEREFRNFNDRLVTLRLDSSRIDPHRGWGLRYQTGTIAGHSYQILEPTFRYRPTRNFQVSGSVQNRRHFDNTTQTILSANYDLNSFDSVAGRVVQQGRDTNFYVAYKRAGNLGNEYFLILGDPNARQFRPSLVLKAVMPMNWRL